MRYKTLLSALSVVSCLSAAEAHAGLADFFSQPQKQQPSAGCEAYQTLAKEAVTSAGLSREKMTAWMKRSVSSDAFSRVTPVDMIAATDDKDAAGRTVADASVGMLRYIHPQRGYNPSSEDHISLTQEKASSLAVGALQLAGVPEGEMISRTYVQTMAVSGNLANGNAPLSAFRAEQHVRVGRVLNGLPVYRSDAKMAVNGKGEIARITLRWPDVETPVALKKSAPREIKDVTGDIAAFLNRADTDCKGAYPAVQSFVAYAPVTEGSLFHRHIPDEETLSGDARPTPVAPSLVIYAAPAEQKENSGNFTAPGLQVVIPLYKKRVVKVEKTVEKPVKK